MVGVGRNIASRPVARWAAVASSRWLLSRPCPPWVPASRPPEPRPADESSSPPPRGLGFALVVVSSVRVGCLVVVGLVAVGLVVAGFVSAGFASVVGAGLVAVGTTTGGRIGSRTCCRSGSGFAVASPVTGFSVVGRSAVGRCVSGFGRSTGGLCSVGFGSSGECAAGRVGSVVVLGGCVVVLGGSVVLGGCVVVLGGSVVFVGCVVVGRVGSVVGRDGVVG